MFVVGLCVLDLFLLILLYLNREGPKTFETALTITLVILGGLAIFVAKHDPIKKDIDSVVFLERGNGAAKIFFPQQVPFRQYWME